MSDKSAFEVLIIIGSESDIEIARAAMNTLDDLGIRSEARIASAHRTPEHLEGALEDARDRGARVILAAAGMSAHLAGVVASKSLLPVIGIPVAAGSLLGLDALLSTVNMPAGVPVGTVSIGLAGARNGALLAARIIALGDRRVAEALEKARAAMRDKVIESDRNLFSSDRD